MNPAGKSFSFVAESAAEAVAQIRARLGPEAMVVNVRKLPPEGLARLWQKPRIEVIARLPEPAAEEEVAAKEQGGSPVLAELEALRREMGEMRRRIDVPREPAADTAIFSEAAQRLASAPPPTAFEPAPRNAQSVPASLTQSLQSMGLSPMAAAMVEDRLLMLDAHALGRPLGDQLQLAHQVLESLWRPARESTGGLHLLIGPAGSGKTTALCKWLTQVSLIEGRLGSLWRLDGVTANQAEHLSVHGEILGVPVERSWPGSLPLGDIGFIDLPGVDWRDRSALQELRRITERFGDVRVHLVLNAAYETDTLLAQARAFSALPVQDIIVTHLDEELRWSKLWNLVLGTNLPISFLGAGQNLPGIFERASSRNLLARSSARSQGGKAVFSAGSGR